ncbi:MULTISPECIES: hypothetical protein [Anaerolinea]|uniref:hypothetical protein n=1 Tax=Anaerolinea TaxID=233189 RepID=UPI002605B9EA|nr:hypothetical protein [Anaerolinea thermophila]
MVFQLVPDAPLPPGETISLQLSLSSDSIIFQDKEGNVLPETLTLTAGGTSPQSKVVVYPSLLAGTTPAARHRVIVKVRQMNRWGEKTFTVELPAPNDGLWRLILERILELSIIGLILQQLGVFIDRVEKENREGEAKARQFLDESSPEKVGILEAIHRWSLKQKEWKDRSRKKLLEEKRQQWANHPNHQKRYLQSLGRLSDSDAVHSLDESVTFFKGAKWFGENKLEINLSACLKALKEILEERVSESDWKGKAGQVLEVWDHFDLPSRDVILKALKRLEPQMLQMLKQEPSALEEHLFKTPNRRRLILFLSEEMQGKLKAYIPEIKTTLEAIPEPEDPPAIKEFLSQQYGIRRNPFGVVYTLVDPLVWKTALLLPPSAEEWLFSGSPCIFLLQDFEDGEAVVQYTAYQRMNGKKPDEFVLCAQLKPSRDLSLSPLQQVTSSVAEIWMDLLTASPWTALDLPPARRALLGRLLVWRMGDASALRLHLTYRQGEGQNKDAIEVFLDEIEKQIENGWENPPARELLIEGCALRPVQVKSTWLLLQDTTFPEQDPLLTRWWQVFSSLVPELLARNIVPKVFTCFNDLTINGFDKMALQWSEDELERHLQNRFAAVGGQDFSQLFSPYESQEASEAFFKACKGSYARMLRLGQALIQHHVRQFPTQKEISLDELREVIANP